MIHYLCYCCAIFFALICLLLATRLSAQAQTRKAYVSQSEDKTTLTFYYDALRATRTGTTWGIEETKKEGDIPVPAWAETWDVADYTTTARVVFDASFRDFRPTTTAKWFHYCVALKQIEGLEYLNTSEVKDMSYMFSACKALTSLDLKNFNTQNVTNMEQMFANCEALISLDLKNFDTQNVTDMRKMFSGCAALTTINSNTAWWCWESENMFAGCTKLKGAVAYDKNKVDAKMANPTTGYFVVTGLENLQAYVQMSADKTTLTFYYDALRATRTGTTWGIEETKRVILDGTFPAWAGTSQEVDTTTTRVVFDASFRDFRPTTTAKWFYDCNALKQIEGLEYLNTSEVKDMSRMFWGCSALTSLDLKHFNTQNVTNMEGMFRRCSALTSLDLQHFNTQNVTDMRIMFDDCKALKTLDLQNFNTQNVTDMYGMFWNCAALTSLDLQHFNTQNVIEMSLMFAHCLALTSLDVQNFNTQKVTNMFWMFHSCSALTSLDVQNFNTQNVTDMSGMFAQCSALTSLDVQNFNTQNVTDMSVMFSGCSALTTLNLQNFNTQNVTNMLGMFSGCSALTSLDLQHFNTQNVTNMKAMFSGCSALTTLNLQNFNTQKVTDMNWMFYACPALTTIYSNTAWRCPKSDDMFFCNPKLKGAVSYDGKNRDVMMANPETGYFTAKPTMVESYRRRAAHLPAARKRGARKHLPAGV